MSSLTRCNYCTLQDMKKVAAMSGKEVRVLPGRFQLEPRDPDTGEKQPAEGWDVYLVSPGEEVDQSVDARGNHAGPWAAWLWSIPDHCVC